MTKERAVPMERAVADDEPGGGGLPPVPRSTDFVIVTGMSGAGRSTAANVIEDRGWYVVDNLPPQLLSAMAELAGKVRGTGESDLRIAAVQPQVNMVLELTSMHRVLTPHATAEQAFPND